MSKFKQVPSKTVCWRSLEQNSNAKEDSEATAVPVENDQHQTTVEAPKQDQITF